MTNLIMTAAVFNPFCPGSSPPPLPKERPDAVLEPGCWNLVVCVVIGCLCLRWSSLGKSGTPRPKRYGFPAKPRQNIKFLVSRRTWSDVLYQKDA